MGLMGKEETLSEDKEGRDWQVDSQSQENLPWWKSVG
jgi:hypothetical protein